MLIVQYKIFEFLNLRVSLPYHSPLHVQLSIWAYLCCPVGNGPQETGANADSVAIATAVCNSLLSLT